MSKFRQVLQNVEPEATIRHARLTKTKINKKITGRNKTRDQRQRAGTKIRDQILSAEYGYKTCMYQAEIYVKCKL